MKSKAILTLLLVPVILASCVTASNCAGWRPVTTDQAATVDYLAAHDPAFLAAVIGHQEFGQKQGCWK